MQGRMSNGIQMNWFQDIWKTSNNINPIFDCEIPKFDLTEYSSLFRLCGVLATKQYFRTAFSLLSFYKFVQEHFQREQVKNVPGRLNQGFTPVGLTAPGLSFNPPATDEQQHYTPVSYAARPSDAPPPPPCRPPRSSRSPKRQVSPQASATGNDDHNRDSLPPPLPSVPPPSLTDEPASITVNGVALPD